MSTAARALASLERHREDFRPAVTQTKLAALRHLVRARLRTAGQVRRLHEVLCFMRACPDSPALLRAVERLLTGFERRTDLRAHRDALADSGIAGTVMGYPFFYPSAHWISRRWPDALRLDRSDTIAGESIAKSLPALMGALEGFALRESHLPGYAALDAVRGTRTDATYLLDRIAAMAGDGFAREAFYDLINPSCELLPGKGTPERTSALYAGGPRAWQTGSLHHARPDLRREIARPPRSIRRVPARDAQTLIDLARAAMISRCRDLDAFAYGNEDDVWLCTDDGALAFALIGMQPERRAALPAIYGGLTLRNGVPVGYHQADFLGRTAAVSFNTFETFRGGESAMVFGRLLATLRAFGGATSFSIEPYQLGQDNDEGIESGAWWFYFKLGFRPRALAAVRLANAEAQRQQRRSGYRSSPAVLRQLARHHLIFDFDPGDAAPLLLPVRIGLRISAARAGVTRHLEHADDDGIVEAAMRRCGLASLRGLARNERDAWTRLAPLYAALPLQGWTAAEIAALVPLARAKGAASERGYARRLFEHRRLEATLAAWQEMPIVQPRAAR
ncbi:MAG TPA: hypothetical protein PLE54_08850 [Burkholderiaceae bacterium]|nr:hypothetical protein [Burkholderiaceae bacterium]HQR70699.1 hypothetical protein [Burkholderiaceae bacterium]